MIRKLLLVGVMSASCSLMGMAEYCVSEIATLEKRGSVEFALLKALQAYSKNLKFTGFTISYPNALLGEFMRMKVPVQRAGTRLVLSHSVGSSTVYSFVPMDKLSQSGNFSWTEILSLIAIGSNMQPSCIEVESGAHDWLSPLQATFDSVRNKLTIVRQP